MKTNKQTFKIKYTYLIAIIAVFALNMPAYSQLSFNDALAKAKSQNKKIIVDVYTDWCGWCKKMDSDVYDNSKVKKLMNKSFVLVKLDAESLKEVTYAGTQYTEQDLASLFDASGYPTTVFLEPDGKIIEFKYDNVNMKNIPGYLKTDDFRKILKYVRDEKYKDTDLSTIF